VITDISLDHQKFLGDTVGEIAREKVGIIRPGGVVVTLPQQPEANDVIGNTILDLGARGVSAVPFVPPVSPGSGEYLVAGTGDPQGLKPALLVTGGGTAESRALPKAILSKPIHETRSSIQSAEYVYRYPLEVMGKQILVETPLVGRHQLRNVALAIAAAEQLSRQGFAGITAETIERGMWETHWPGRFQVIPAKDGSPETVLDVAHNPAGAWALRSALSERYEDRPLIFVFGAMRDKAISEMAEILFPLADRVIGTRVDNPRSASPEEIQQAGARTGAEIEVAADTAAALERARACAGSDTVLVITGSIYLVGEAIRLLRATI
jgi:dihydrofolate synthase/folylpolyglutamate synthase